MDIFYDCIDACFVSSTSTGSLLTSLPVTTPIFAYLLIITSSVSLRFLGDGTLIFIKACLIKNRKSYCGYLLNNVDWMILAAFKEYNLRVQVISVMINERLRITNQIFNKTGITQGSPCGIVSKGANLSDLGNVLF